MGPGGWTESLITPGLAGHSKAFGPCSGCAGVPRGRRTVSDLHLESPSG